MLRLGGAGGCAATVNKSETTCIVDCEYAFCAITIAVQNYTYELAVAKLDNQQVTRQCLNSMLIK